MTIIAIYNNPDELSAHIISRITVISVIGLIIFTSWIYEFTIQTALWKHGNMLKGIFLKFLHMNHSINHSNALSIEHEQILHKQLGKIEARRVGLIDLLIEYAFHEYIITHKVIILSSVITIISALA